MSPDRPAAAPVVWLLEAVRIPGGASSNVHVHASALLMVMIDTICCWAPWTRSPRLGALPWIGLTSCIGPLMWFRIDLIPADAAIGLGAAMRLWSALLILPLLGADRPGRRRGLGFALAGGTLGAASRIAEGWGRSSSPLAWQDGRGLQVGPVWATPLVAARMFSGDWHVRLSRYNAHEVFGPGAHALARAASDSMLVVALPCLVLGRLIGFGGAGLCGHRVSNALAPCRRRDRELALLLELGAVVCAVIVANRAFSPQHVIWLAGPFAVLGSVHLRSSDRRHATALLIMTLCCAGLTQLIFYSSLVAPDDPGARVSVLPVVRNLLVRLLAVYSAVPAPSRAWRLGRPVPGQLALSIQSDDEEPHE
ncbi:hypothetical protein [uncultured Propionibacterium sp.]|uniref:hypothetical protein n=1 Tax=uncultured Propionibacterium sp. TaxID=218066 RepID=UPI00292D899B|nr:hypothetical protein [uncultured Propionibacterium sp.]